MAPTRNASPPAPRARTRIAEILAAGSVALLVAFHVLILWERVISLRLLEPAIALRWAATPVLLLLLLHLRRRGVPIVWGRQALAFWLLVLILHVSYSGPVAVEAQPGVDPRPVAGLLIGLPATFAAALSCLLSVVFRARRASRGRSSRGALRLLARLARPPAPLPIAAGWVPAVGCRPPPA